MALQIDLDATKTNIGVAAPSCYAKIGGMQFNDQTFVRFTVLFYFDQAARTAGVNPIKMEEFTFENFDHDAAQNPKAQLYAHLKTLPAFDGATDV